MIEQNILAIVKTGLFSLGKIHGLLISVFKLSIPFPTLESQTKEILQSMIKVTLQPEKKSQHDRGLIHPFYA